MAKSKGTAAIYLRISRDAQGKKLGIKRQRKACVALAAQLKLDVFHIYKDNDIGASEMTGDKERPEYDEMLRHARAGKFGTIIAYSNSRLTRRLREFGELLELFDETGVGVQTVVSGTDDYSTADGRMIAGFKAIVDSAESRRISERQKATFSDNAYQGKPKLQRQRPFGWKKDGVTLKPKEARLIREAVEKILQGASLASIRDEWQAAGVRTAAGGEKWDHSVLKRVLTGWRTAGVRTYLREPLFKDGEPVMGLWEPIITLEERDRALAMLSKRARYKVRSHKWLLPGFVRCAECGGKMYGQLTGTPTYACKPGNGHVAITASLLEEHVLRALAGRIISRGGTRPTEEDAPREWPDEERLKVVGRKLEENREDYNLDRISRSDYHAQLARLGDERTKLEREREKFYAATVKPKLTRSSSKQIMEWALDFTSVEPAPKLSNRTGYAERENAPWGAEDHDSLRGLPPAPERDPDSLRSPDLEWELELDTQPAKEVAVAESSVDEDYFAEQREMALRRELKRVFVKKGNRGRAGWGRSAFLERVEIEWMD
ncbi:recombinase family protein [Pseudoclavibacter terrae]|uniref:recombinase family protein n=1 Tax=Pseudoclavibacter terrae TaxID=1530195 RepID=UPI00232BCED7|nr:recombinase family protein [Pseudoclavibacter terrae]